jgi:hypothetical protein
MTLMVLMVQYGLRIAPRSVGVMLMAMALRRRL